LTITLSENRGGACAKSERHWPTPLKIHVHRAFVYLLSLNCANDVFLSCVCAFMAREYISGEEIVYLPQPSIGERCNTSMAIQRLEMVTFENAIIKLYHSRRAEG